MPVRNIAKIGIYSVDDSTVKLVLEVVWTKKFELAAGRADKHQIANGTNSVDFRYHFVDVILNLKKIKILLIKIQLI